MRGRPRASVPRALEGWRSRDRRGEDGAVESVQTVRSARPLVEPSEDGAQRLARAYWRAVAWGPVGARANDGRVALRLLGLPLLTFEGPRVAIDGEHVTCTYGIRGGLLARRPGGTISLAQAGPELTVAVEGFFPRLARLHNSVQSRIHAAVSRRYFRALLAEAAR